MSKLSEMLIENPIIAAIKSDEDLSYALRSNAKIIFVLYGNLLNIHDICEKLREVHKIIFIHMDFIEGLKENMQGIEYINEVAKPDGIITTKSNCIKYANQLELQTILRIFLIDSLSIKTAAKNINITHPNAVEVMPGVASKAIRVMKNETKVYIIAGGLINEKKEVIDALSTGAVAISTTERKLWEL